MGCPVKLLIVLLYIFQNSPGNHGCQFFSVITTGFIFTVWLIHLRPDLLSPQILEVTARFLWSKLLHQICNIQTGSEVHTNFCFQSSAAFNLFRGFHYSQFKYGEESYLVRKAELGHIMSQSRSFITALVCKLTQEKQTLEVR